MNLDLENYSLSHKRKFACFFNDFATDLKLDPIDVHIGRGWVAFVGAIPAVVVRGFVHQLAPTVVHHHFDVFELIGIEDLEEIVAHIAVGREDVGYISLWCLHNDHNARVEDTTLGGSQRQGEKLSYPSCILCLLCRKEEGITRLAIRCR